MRKISVIIPTYNRADTILRSVNSVLEQTYGELEVIVVDDMSTDDTKSVICSIEDPRIRYHCLTENRGPSAARNAGAQIAAAEIIAFQDSDDAWRPDKLEKQIRYWEQHRDYSMIYSRMMRHETQRDIPIPAYDTAGTLEGDLFRDLLLRNTISTQTIVVDKEAFFSCGGFDETIRCIEDWDFVIRFARDYLIGFVDEALVDVYPSVGSVSDNMPEFLRVRANMIKKYGLDITRYDLMEDIFAELIWRAEGTGNMDCLRDILSKLSV